MAPSLLSALAGRTLSTALCADEAATTETQGAQGRSAGSLDLEPTRSSDDPASHMWYVTLHHSTVQGFMTWDPDDAKVLSVLYFLSFVSYHSTRKTE